MTQDLYGGKAFIILRELHQNGPMFVTQLMSATDRNFYFVKEVLAECESEGLVESREGRKNGTTVYTLTLHGYSVFMTIESVRTFEGYADIWSNSFEEWQIEKGDGLTGPVSKRRGMRRKHRSDGIARRKGGGGDAPPGFQRFGTNLYP